MINWKKIIKNIPNKVQVKKNVWYEVLYANEFANPDILGETRFDRKQIVIKSGESPRETVFTFIHETYHAFSEEYDIGLTENQVIALEKGVYYWIKLFKELLK